MADYPKMPPRQQAEIRYHISQRPAMAVSQAKEVRVRISVGRWKHDNNHMFKKTIVQTGDMDMLQQYMLRRYSLLEQLWHVWSRLTEHESYSCIFVCFLIAYVWKFSSLSYFWILRIEFFLVRWIECNTLLSSCLLKSIILI